MLANAPSVGSYSADDSLLQRGHHFRDEFLPAVQYSEQRILARGRVFDIVSLSSEACVDEIGRFRDRRRQRLRIKESDTFKGIDDPRKARVSKRAAKNGGQVAGKAVLGKVAERVAVGDTFEGESSQKRQVGEVVAEEIRSCDRDLAARKAERSGVQGGGQDTSRRPSVNEDVSQTICEWSKRRKTKVSTYENL